jgi:hypothetical protein
LDPRASLQPSKKTEKGGKEGEDYIAVFIGAINKETIHAIPSVEICASTARTRKEDFG